MVMNVLIDGDVIAYAVGFASQDTDWMVDGRVFPKKADATAFVEKYELNVEPTPRITPEPLEYCLSSVKRMVKNIVEDCGADTYTLVLSGKDNFRMDVATLRPYKGNRVSAKPFYFDDIKAYMINVLNTHVTYGEEADDYLSYTSLDTGDIIATIDKDLRNTAGKHYNWNRKCLDEVSEIEANCNFWTQMLTGDATDNIPGLFRLTGVKASKAFKDEVDACYTYDGMRTVVIHTYQRAFEKKMGDDAPSFDEQEAMLTEIGQLLWMRRAPNEMWSLDYEG
jgi:hypothetical protein